MNEFRVNFNFRIITAYPQYYYFVSFIFMFRANSYSTVTIMTTHSCIICPSSDCKNCKILAVVKMLPAYQCCQYSKGHPETQNRRTWHLRFLFWQELRWMVNKEIWRGDTEKSKLIGMNDAGSISPSSWHILQLKRKIPIRNCLNTYLMHQFSCIT